LPQYNYTATDFQLKRKSGQITASSSREARRLLREKGLFVLDIKEYKPIERKNINFSLTKPKINVKEITLFSRQFATLIEAGIPISRSLYILTQNTRNKQFAKILNNIRTQIEQGTSLSVALSKYDKIFPPIYIDMVASGEVSGALHEVLDRLASYMENEKSIKSKVKSAFIYPTIVLVVAIAVVFLMLIYVIPKFIPIFEDMGEQLPLPTRMLLNLSEFMQTSWWMLIVGFLVMLIAIGIYRQTPMGRKQTDILKLKIPIIGDVISKSAIARFCRTLETLQRSGVPLIQSLGIVGKTSGNYVIQRAVENSITSLENGEGISAPLAESGAFPVLVTQMISIGEETGELEQILTKIADFYEEEVGIAVATMTSLIEPIITVFLGVLIGFIAVAIIMPMYEMMGNLQEM
jgi:type IV pilus assembly protein PilC